MEVALSQLIQLSPELASTLREEVRSGRLPARRQMGVAGRPYVVELTHLLESDRDDFRELAEIAESSPLPTVRRTRRPRNEATPESVLAPVWPLVKMMEAQHAMLQDLVGVLTHEMRGRRDHLDRHESEIQELSYKLGQAHQEIGRLERTVADRSLSAMRGQA